MKYAQSKKGWTRPEFLCAVSSDVRRKSEYGEGTLYWCLLKQSGERKTLVSRTTTNVVLCSDVLLLRKTKRSIWEKSWEEDASDCDIPEVGGKVARLDADCCMESDPEGTSFFSV